MFNAAPGSSFSRATAQSQHWPSAPSQGVRMGSRYLALEPYLEARSRRVAHRRVSTPSARVECFRAARYAASTAAVRTQPGWLDTKATLGSAFA